ncbi:hypothetical protein K505DRAFT_362950 [Melanomma pulvis-pyrius CBS 109.77]|uniref:Uncharacterized protein n=1 Tax=Melanomma pulvis-pyrius CBS 109.77 TaxID=1314802 RepID=A0A6A6X7P9_9PLEO|nr:hypothetical protein K505DRAFT_362950 [Melanomma pulvis-pyrius CBS 109.77]
MALYTNNTTCDNNSDNESLLAVIREYLKTLGEIKEAMGDISTSDAEHAIDSNNDSDDNDDDDDNYDNEADDEDSSEDDSEEDNGPITRAEKNNRLEPFVNAVDCGRR